MRTNAGHFKRKHHQWSLENFDDGYVDAGGRMRVYYPGHHRAAGPLWYVLRAVVAYEQYHNTKVDLSMNIHHKDHNRLNDSKENLELISHREHSLRHNPPVLAERKCLCCGGVFYIRKHRLREKGRGTFCSHKCYNLWRRP